jgi:very-short-patch-repair endonuclease
MTTTSFVPRTSYIEDRFFSFWQKCHIPYTLIRQHKVGPYYADFAHLESHTIIEIDGIAYHASPAQIQHDQYRQRRLEDWGWVVIRFTGKEVYRDPVRTVYHAERAIEKNLPY